jgi:hypothetical protein
MKQTAVEWLSDEIIIIEERLRQEKINLNDFMDLKDDLVTKALKMEKQQIIDAYENGYSDSDNTFELNKQYYNEQFKNK